MTNTLHIVVPVYNVAPYLRRCVDSLLAQTYPHVTITLVDDGSTDDSGKICDELAGLYPTLTVIHRKNGGLSAARNTGLDAVLTHGHPDDFIVFIDSDDFVTADFAARLMGHLARTGASALQCACERGSGDAFTPLPSAYTPQLQVLSARDALLGYALKSQSTPKLYRLSLFDGLRFTPGVLNEDEFITYRLVWRAGKVVITDEPLYYYYQHPGSIMGGVARRLKGNPHRYDWMHAYLERYCFFDALGERDLALRTLEKICTDIILRYTEQMMLEPEARDEAVGRGEYLRTYRNLAPYMLRRRGMPPGKRGMYLAFYLWPGSAGIAAKFTALRK